LQRATPTPRAAPCTDVASPLVLVSSAHPTSRCRRPSGIPGFRRAARAPSRDRAVRARSYRRARTARRQDPVRGHRGAVQELTVMVLVHRVVEVAGRRRERPNGFLPRSPRPLRVHDRAMLHVRAHPAACIRPPVIRGAEPARHARARPRSNIRTGCRRGISRSAESRRVNGARRSVSAGSCAPPGAALVPQSRRTGPSRRSRPQAVPASRRDRRAAASATSLRFDERAVRPSRA